MTQKVLITAAASGIGLEIARAFSAAGAKVFITDINTQALMNLAEVLNGRRPREISRFSVNLIREIQLVLAILLLWPEVGATVTVDVKA
jgi:NAD(P)-dependent dehydrogenase (short-subunit alcohol dehydrogenase family)